MKTKKRKKRVSEITNKRVEVILTKALDLIRQGKMVNMGKLMIEAGYSKWSAHNVSIKKTDAWQRVLDKIKDYKILSRFEKIAMGKIRGGGVREQIQAGVEVIKLKDRYPDRKLRIGAFDDRDKVIDAPEKVKEIAQVKEIEKPDENSQREETSE